MLVRLLQIGIVIFWLSTVCWLGFSVWSPSGFRMQKAEPEEVLDLFFEWNDATQMALLENGKWVGRLSLSGAAGEDKRVGEYRKAASMSGTMKGAQHQVSDDNLMDVFFRGNLEFSETMTLKEGDFSLGVSSQKLSVLMALLGDPPTLRAQAKVGDQVLFQYGDPTKKDSADDLAEKLPFGGAAGNMGLSGFFPGQLGLTPGQTYGDLDSVNIGLAAWRGKKEFGGRDLPIYLVEFDIRDYDQKVRIFVSETGEPLRVETTFGYEAVSEVLVPLDAYQKSQGIDENS